MSDRAAQLDPTCWKNQGFFGTMDIRKRQEVDGAICPSTVTSMTVTLSLTITVLIVPALEQIEQDHAGDHVGKGEERGWHKCHVASSGEHEEQPRR